MGGTPIEHGVPTLRRPTNGILRGLEQRAHLRRDRSQPFEHAGHPLLRRRAALGLEDLAERRGDGPR